MKRSLVLIPCILFLAVLASIGLASAEAINDTFHINLQTTFSNGSIQSGTFAFAFNITENSSALCGAPIVYNYSTSLTTDSRGITSIYLPTNGSNGGNLSQLSFDKQYYLCYYRDGVLKDVSQLGRVPYAFRATQVNLSEVTINSNLNLNNSGQYNITANHGFFSFLGNLTRRITTLFVQNINASGDINASGIFTGNGSGLTNVNSDLLDGRDSSFFMPLNTSVVGNFSFNGGWENGGLSIENGNLFAQTIFVFNITSLNVTRQNLTINDDLLVFGNTDLRKNLTVDSGTLFVNSNVDRVGINITTPQNTLNVKGGFNVSNVSGVTFLFVNESSGNVGIGTTSPSGQLTLGADSKEGIRIISTSGFFPFSVYDSTNTTVLARISPVTGDVFSAGTFSTDSGFRVTAFGAYTGVLSGNRFVFNNGNIQVKSSTDTEVARFTDSNVGINTTNPQNTLNIIGDANATGTIYSNNLNLTRAYVWVTNNTFLQIGNWNATNTSYRTLTNGTFIGEWNTTGNILINNTNVLLISQWNATNTTYREKYNLTWVGNFNATSNVTLGTNRFFLDDATGNVGIGTTDPTSAIGYNSASKVLGISGDASASISSHGLISLSNNRATPAVNDGIGQIDFVSVNNGGAGAEQGARILSQLEGSGGVNGFGAFLKFDTKQDNTSAVAERMRITAAGNVGIGTTSPGVALDIVGSNTGSLRLTVSTTNATDKLGRIVGRPYTNTDTDFLAFDIRGVIGANQINYGGGSGLLNAVTSHHFYTASDKTTLSGTERMIIDSSGNVGIGTTSPARIFTINATDTTSRLLIQNPSSGTSIGDGLDLIQSTLNASLWNYEDGFLRFATNNLERVRIESGGNVGIGTTSPSHKLNVVGTGFVANFTGTSAGAGILITNQQASGRTWAIGDNVDALGVFTIQESGDVAGTGFHLDNAGNVGIGTTTPEQLLHIKGAFGRLKLESTTAGASNWSFLPDSSPSGLQISENSNTRLFIENGGEIGIGNTAPAGKLHINFTSEFPLILQDTADGSDIRFDVASGEFRIYTGTVGSSTQKMVIQSDGDVGIGTTNPQNLLNVLGDANITRTLFFGSLPASSINTTYIVDGTIAAADIAASAINTTHILDGTILTGDIAEGTILAGDLAPSSVNTTHILDATILEGDIAQTSSLDSSEIEDIYLFNTGDTATGNYTFDTSTFFIDANGNLIGVGTAAPEGTLDTYGTGYFGFQDFRTQAIQKVLVLRGEPVSGVYAQSRFNFYTTPGTTVNGIAKLTIKSQYSTDAESGVLFTLDGSGNVGIGTTSPTSLLQVKKTGTAEGIITAESDNDVSIKVNSSFSASSGAQVYTEYLDGFIADGKAWQVGKIGGSNNFAIGRDTIGQFTNAMLSIQTNGNVGIGTTSPLARLQVDATDGRHILLSEAGSIAYGEIGYGYNVGGASTTWIGTNLNSTTLTPAQSNTANSSWYSSYNAQADTYTLNRIPAGGSVSALMTVLSSGNVGIGTTTPQNKLNVVGDLNISNTSGSSALYIANSGIINGSNQPRVKVNNSVDQLTLAGTRELTPEWDTESFDVASMHSTSPNADRLTVPPGGGGLYLVHANLIVRGGTTVTASLRINNTVFAKTYEDNSNSNNATSLSISTLMSLSEGNFVNVLVETSGGGVNVQLESESYFEAAKLW